MARRVSAHYHSASHARAVLSKRKLQKLVDTGVVTGWSDPRFPTVQGILRRGLTQPALREFILLQGASKNNNLQEWDKIWAINKKVRVWLPPPRLRPASDARRTRGCGEHCAAPRSPACCACARRAAAGSRATAFDVYLPGRGCTDGHELAQAIDPVAPRHTAVARAGAVTLRLSGAPDAVESRTVPKHKKNPAVGTKTVLLSSTVLLEQEDAASIRDGEEV